MAEALDRQERDAAIDTARTLDQLRDLSAGCRACELWARATQTVFGDGRSPRSTPRRSSAPAMIANT